MPFEHSISRYSFLNAPGGRFPKDIDQLNGIA